MVKSPDDDPVFGWNLEYGDWRPESERETEAPSLALLVPGVGKPAYEGEDEAAKAFKSDTEDLIRRVTEADEVYVRFVDPDVGAAGFGVGVLLKFLEVGATLIAWAGAAIWLAPRIREAVNAIKSNLDAPVYLSRDALTMFVIYDICNQEGVEPESIDVEDVRCITHACTPTEARLELQQIYAVHAVIVRATVTKWPSYAWSYFVTADGSIISKGKLAVPNPGGPRWGDIDVDGPKLRGLGE